MKALIKVEKHGIRISMQKLKGFKQGDIVEIEFKKIYANDEDKKALEFPFFFS